MGSFFNFAENFKELKEPTCEEILKKVRQAVIYYWITVVIAAVVTLWGVSMISQSSANNSQALIGLLVAVTGPMLVLYIKISVQIRLSFLALIWFSNNRIEAEIRKSEAADL